MNYPTIYHLVNAMKKLLFIILITLFAGHVYAQGIPDPPNPPRLVNDFAGVLTPEQVDSLESKLEDFARSTTTQILIVTVSSLDGYDISDYSFQLGEKWGVGQKGKNNGVVIIFKPKTDQESGQAFIAVGYGLEGIIPDATANHIVNNEMIPHFKTGDIYGGLSQGSQVIMSLASQEFTAQEYEEKTSSGNDTGMLIPGIFVFIVFLIIIGLATRNRSQNFTMGNAKSGFPFWILLSMLGNFGGSNNKDWGDFTHGGGGFGGSGGGGFGGFGGGSFGGGGAGGRW